MSDSLELFKAVESANVESIQKVLEAGADVNCTNADGKTLLHVLGENTSIEYSTKLKITEFLFSKGANLLLKDNENNTVLHAIAMSNDCELADFYIRNGVDVNAENNDMITALALTCRCYKEEPLDDMIKLLIKHKTQLNKSENMKNDAGILWQYMNNSLDRELRVIKLLVEAGANVTEISFGRTFLHMYNWLDDENEYIDYLKLFLSFNLDIHAKDNDNRTVLQIATEDNHTEVIHLLLAHDAYE